jgi:ribose/xylose/arabinose/galactoside ABC-type transport system permease subunit
MSRLRAWFGYRASSVFLVLVALALLFTFLSPGHRFASADNLRILLVEGSEFCIVVLGVGLLMICGEFDLSVGSILVFCSFVFIRLFQAGVNLFLVLAAVLALGAAVGLLNGLVTVKGRIPSFITTLGAMMFWRGITLLFSEGYTAAFDQAASPRLTALLSGTIAGVVPVQAAWFAGIAPRPPGPWASRWTGSRSSASPWWACCAHSWGSCSWCGSAPSFPAPATAGR